MSASSAFSNTFARGASGNDGRRETAASISRLSPADQEAPSGVPASTGRGAGTTQAPLKLTRRGRFVFIGVPLILLAALILSFSGFFSAPAKAAESAAELSPTPSVTVTVQPGESLWAIARTVAPERDPRDVVSEIIELNNLEASQLEAGQALFIPSK
ncbi:MULTISPECIES: LysM peptidoglycan-binding domain-containing protein [unclassified Arthrobacter]|uniref:LysM peptidoglycan-binding domain-containing protein n=1 Tax=unclassified Arthrobacter TaxID=235627 RepID=UPI002E0B1349|nr:MULTISPECIES: LysM peptidoglycan-binding domain-containing protein [unclassified Arthrobacter]MEC5190593.1 LysM repeat protein [Arthrobacter sp. MP_M4]MEC5201944.1 LysM repeat protein [Arthrobacter sp. MP_M7]